MVVASARRARIAILFAAAAVALAVALGTAASASAATVDEPLCPPPAPGYATCESEIVVNPATDTPATPAFSSGTAAPHVGSPAWLQWAYDLQGAAAAGPSSTDTVAVVDPYGDAQAENDLAYYRSTFGLPPCTSAGGCFRKVDQSGGTSYPADPTGSNSGWVTETSLDLDMVSAICPACHIVLVQANDAGDGNLAAAELTAAALAPQQITNSWSWTGNPNYDGDFNPPGIAVVAATGDGGYGTFGVPAELPSVTAAGGTSLPAAASARGFAESAWSKTASGCASGKPTDLAHYPAIVKPSWQKDTGCADRTLADLSADSDPSTSAVIAYDSTVDKGFFAAGGTSVASPIIAAYYALVGGGAGDGGAAWAYSHAAALNDVNGGSDGTCSPTAAYLCTGEPGYDGPTGEGSVSGDLLAGPPQVAGSYAASTTGTSVTVAGGVYTNQYDTQAFWQYGTDTGYGQSTAPIDVPSAPGVSPLSTQISGLTPNTVYHFRLVAASCAGADYGYDASFSSTPSSTTTSSTTTTTSTASTSTTTATTSATATTTTMAACPVLTTSTTASTDTAFSGAAFGTQTAQTVTQHETASQSTASAPLITQTTTTRTTTSTRAATPAVAALRVGVGPFARPVARTLRVRVTCSRACAGRLEVRHDGMLLGGAVVALRRGASVKLSVALDARGRALALAAHRVPAVVSLVLNGHPYRATIAIL